MFITASPEYPFMVFGLLLDPGVNIAFQNFSPVITSFFTQGEFLDSMPWYFLIISVVTFGLHPRSGVRLAALFGLNVGLNEAVKLACHMPRPYWVSSAVKAVSAHSSFGFPSGAAMSGAVIYGYIATTVRRWCVLVVCILLLLATSLVRIFSGIHFLLDIIGGWIIGFILLAVFLFAAPRAEAFARGLSRSARLLLYLIAAAIPLIIVFPAFLSLGSYTLPPDWVAGALQQTGKAIDPVRIQFSYGASGIIFGSLFGYEYLRSRGGWNPPAELQRRLVVLAAGAISVLLINAALPVLWKTTGLSAISPQLATFLSMACATAWLIAGVPLVAARAGYSA